jgi:hypothetical protein
MTYSSGTGTPAPAQVVTGATSHFTAVVDKVATGYIVVKTLTGTFTPGETISTATFSGSLTAQTDYQNNSSEYEFYWDTNQSNVACRFYRGKSMYNFSEKGVSMGRDSKCSLPTTVNITPQTMKEYRIGTSEAMFSGTYSIEQIYPFTGMGIRVDHLEAVLKVIP